MANRERSTPARVVTVTPDWPGSRWVRACTTARGGGCSGGPYRSLNMAAHVGDEPRAVAENRRRVMTALKLPRAPLWLTQVHGATVVDAAAAATGAVADGAYTTQPGVVCAVLTADCLPVLLCSRGGEAVAAVHAGWRGLAAGVIGKAVAALGGGDLLAWLGPAIGPLAYEVGEDVMGALSRAVEDPPPDTFLVSSPGKWRVNLYQLARRALAAAGVHRVYGGHWCTFGDAQRFYSYRRDGVTGRMATLIWLGEGP